MNTYVLARDFFEFKQYAKGRTNFVFIDESLKLKGLRGARLHCLPGYWQHPDALRLNLEARIQGCTMELIKEKAA